MSVVDLRLACVNCERPWTQADGEAMCGCCKSCWHPSGAGPSAIAPAETLTALDVATVALTTPEIIAQFVENLPPERLASAVIKAGAVSAALKKLADLAESRMATNGIRHYVDPETDDKYELMSSGRRVADDIPALFDELVKAGASLASIAECVTADGLRVTDLRALAKRLADRPGTEAPKADPENYFRWKTGPLHLKKVEDDKP